MTGRLVRSCRWWRGLRILCFVSPFSSFKLPVTYVFLLFFLATLFILAYSGCDIDAVQYDRVHSRSKSSGTQAGTVTQKGNIGCIIM